MWKNIYSESRRLDVHRLDGVLLQVLVVGDVVAHGLLNHVGSLLAELLAPFSIELLVGLGSFLLDGCQLLARHLEQGSCSP